ncbi:MAG: hypothetical protein ACO1N0_08735 [Fluviicola sp.]
MTKIHQILALGILIVFMSSCRKEKPVPIQEGVEIVSSTCSNGIKDAGEDGVDCGPECVPCIMSHPSGYESLTTNKIETSAFFGNVTFADANVLSSVVNGRFVISATYGSVTVRVIFANEAPEAFKPYNLINNPLPTGEDACIQIQYGSTIYNSYSEDVHLNFENGHYSVEFVNVYLESYSAAYIISDGRLICSN